MIAEGIVHDASKPFDWSCGTCDASSATRAQFFSAKEHSEFDPLIPYLQVEVDLAGPFAVDDPNGNMYLFSAIDRASGELWVQPLKSKADAWRAMQAYLVHVRTVVPGAELRLKISIMGVVTVYLDRGGEFTTTWGFTQSVFDELLEQRGIRRRLNSPDTPKKWDHDGRAGVAKSGRIGNAQSG